MSDKVSQIERILIVDDNPRVRGDYEFPINAAGRTPVAEKGPLGSIDRYLAKKPPAEAAVSDYQLTPANYASFNGVELVSEWYKIGFPAILCTTFDKSNADHFRSFRRWLPVVMAPGELSPETLMEGLELVQNEIHDVFVPPRRPWRALVHFVDYQEATRTLYAKLPGWGVEAVALRVVDLPIGVQEKALSQADFRCYAVANLGAESNDELYISDWEA
jgi:hypothetical protein